MCGNVGDSVPWEAVLKDKGVQEGWTSFKKETKGTGAGWSYILKEKSLGRKMGLTKQRALARTQGGKRRVYDLWRTRQVTQED